MSLCLSLGEILVALDAFIGVVDPLFRTVVGILSCLGSLVL